jgi:hypothetical protein
VDFVPNNMRHVDGCDCFVRGAFSSRRPSYRVEQLTHAFDISNAGARDFADMLKLVSEHGDAHHRQRIPQQHHTHIPVRRCGDSQASSPCNTQGQRDACFDVDDDIRRFKVGYQVAHRLRTLDADAQRFSRPGVERANVIGG